VLASNIAVKGGAGTVTLGGTLQANTPVAISGNLVQNNGSLLILGIDAASQGRLNVTGTVDMTNGAVRVQPLNGFKLARNGTYTLVDSATPAGTSYAGVQLSLSGYRGFFTTPMIDGHYNLVLNIRSSDYTAIGRASGATPGNMGSTLDQLAANSGAFQQQVLTHIDDLPEGKRQQDAVRQTAPVQTSASAVALNVSAALTTQVVEQHQIGLLAQDGRGGGGIAAGSGGSQKRMWLRVMGGYSNRSTTATVDGYSSRSGGMMIGLDYNLSPTAVVGIGASMMQGRTNTGGVTTGSTTLLTNYSLTAYGTWQFRPGSFVFGQAGGGSNSFTQRRHIGFLGATARSQFSGYQFQLKGGLGHDLHLTDSVTLTPMATLQYLRADTQGYGETGAGLANLQVNRSRVDALVHEVGARVSGRWETPLGTILPEMRLSWTHDYIVGPIAATGQLAGATFFSTTSRLAPDGARLNLAGTLLYSDRLTVRAEYQGDLRSNYNAHTGMLRASLAF
jgi:outer membrane autotransporter protein